MKESEKSRTFTTSFPIAFLHELDQVAKETKLKKSEILVQAFLEWNNERKQARLAASYSKREV